MRASHGALDDPPRLYVVRPGDSLAALARRFRTPGGVPGIVALNDVPSADEIRAGQELRVPPRSPWTDHLRVAPPAARPVDRAEPCASRSRGLEWPRDEWVGERCVAVDDGELCQTLEADGGAVHFSVRLRLGQRDRTHELLQGEAHYPWLGRIEAFTTHLGGAQRAQVVVTRLLAISNGLGHRTYDVAVIETATGAIARFRAMAIDGVEPGVFATPHDGRCALAVRWEERQGAGARGYGNYFVTRYYEFDDGLTPMGGSILRQRLARARDAERLEAEWLESVPRARRTRVTVGPARQVTLEDGTSIEMDGAHTRLGDERTRRLFPVAYSRGGAGWLEGASGSLATYLVDTNDVRRVLWVRPDLRGNPPAP